MRQHMPDDGDEIDGWNRALGVNQAAQQRGPNSPAAKVEVIQGGGVTVEGSKDPVLWTDAGAWDEETLERRPWVVPGYAMRGAVTVVAGMGSAGKSTLMVGWSVACAIGEAISRFVPPGPLKVLTYNVEDDAAEQRRRLSAALRPFGRIPRDIAGRIIRCGPAGVGTLIERDLNGQITLTAAWQGLDALIGLHEPDLVILDPLVELHTAEENDNTALRLVIAHIRELAQRRRCAIILVHHTRKGATAGDMDAIRGAGSLVGAARAAFTVTPMSEEEAETLGISQLIRRHFVRVDSVKGNYAPAQEADWHQLQEYQLDNGETVAAIIPWTPPAATGPSPEALAVIEAELRRGTAGGPYSPRLAVEQPRSVAGLLAQRGITSADRQKATLKALLAAGWQVLRFRDRDGDKRSGLRSPDGLPQAKWLDGEG
jgi:hypothetical protein